MNEIIEFCGTTTVIELVTNGWFWLSIVTGIFLGNIVWIVLKVIFGRYT